jgi:hypothetical protein
MSRSRVRLPRGVRRPFSVFVNGVRVAENVDYTVHRDELHFERELVQEGKLGFWRWFWGAWGIGTYRRDDQVDVAWDVDGRPQVAHKLEVVRISEDAPPAKD